MGTFLDRACNRLSVCMIVKNESALLGRCLKSVAGCADEIVVVDTGSTDDTVAVARGEGATVVQSDWRGDFSYSRNISVRRASGAWILWLDADDVVPAASIPKINELKLAEPARVFGFIVKNEKPGNTGSEFMQARMFPNRKDIFFERRIHEQMMPSALRAGLRLFETDIVIEHHGYADPQTVRAKAGRNVGLLLAEWDNARPDAVMAIEIADSYSMLGDFPKASHWYGTVLEIPGHREAQPEIASQACLGLGNISNGDGKYEEAARWLNESLVLCPNRSDALFSLAVAQDLAGNLEAAAATLRSIVSGAPGKTRIVGIDVRESRIKAYLRLERVLFDLNLGAEALAMAKDAVRALPNRPEILDMAGRVFLKSNLLMDALHAFEQSLAENTDANLEAYIGLSRVYSLANRKETAVQTIAGIRPLFVARPMYWAFWEILAGPAGRAEVPAEIDRKEIDKEASTLRKLYGIP